jgi:hypothetical protein
VSAIIVTGDDAVVFVALKKNGSAFVINPGATVQGAIVSSDRSAILAGPVASLSSMAGANWNISLVAIEMSSSITDAIASQGNALLEVQVDDSGKLTWFVTAYIVKGSIE